MRRALLAAAFVVSAGAAAALAQSSTSQGSSTTSSRNDNSSTGMSSANTGSSTQNSSDMSSTRQSDANNSTSMAGTSSKKLSWGDRRFVTKAADDGQEEVQIAQLAAQKASNPDVKQFAQQLVDQHTQVNQQLMTLASSKNVKVEQDEGKDRMYRRLDKATGQDFDREFVEHMVDEHEKDIKMFEKAAKNAKDPEIRQFASSTLEHLRQHLSQAQQLQQSIIPTGRMDSDSGRSDSSMKDTSSGMSGSTSTSGMSDKSTDTTKNSSSSGYGAGANSGATSTSTATTR